MVFNFIEKQRLLYKTETMWISKNALKFLETMWISKNALKFKIIKFNKKNFLFNINAWF